MSDTRQGTIRKQGLLARRALSAKQRRLKSIQISKRFLRSHYFLRAKLIGIYLSIDDEVDTFRIIQRSWRAKKKIFTPVVTGFGAMQFRELHANTTLRPNRFNILEPVDGEFMTPRMLDVVIAPLAAFDLRGNRIGMGGGYYDRCFSFQKNRYLWRKPKLIGLGFKCQQASQIVKNPWDISLCEVLTD